MTTRRLLPLVFLGALFASAGPAAAGVNLKNGNFYITYTDLVVGEFELSRTYNSKSTVEGRFGFGWGSLQETRLVLSPDGTVVVREHGAGATTLFRPTNYAAEDLNAYVDRLMVNAARLSQVGSEEEARSMRKQLLTDEEKRRAWALRQAKSGLIQRRALPIGAKLWSGQRGLQELVRVQSGYRRTSGKTVELFDLEGRLLRRDEGGASNTALRLGYDPRGFLELIVVGDERITCVSDSNGRLVEVRTSDGKSARYRYNDAGDLVWSNDIGGNVYEYEYDRNHNMTAVRYADGTSLLLNYHPKTQFLASIQNRVGKLTRYEYTADPEDPDNHYWTVVRKKNLLGKDVSDRYEYWIGHDERGASYTKRIETTINNLRTRTEYNRLGLPLLIRRGTRQTVFRYNESGLLTYKRDWKGAERFLEYHPRLNKITKVRDSRGWTTFRYADDGNLNYAENSKGEKVRLVYNEEGQITVLEDLTGGDTLQFEYHPELNKPTKISIDGVGTLDIEYDANGEIEKVDSESGPKMSVKVTQAFQRLLSIVKPAGVSLGF